MAENYKKKYHDLMKIINSSHTPSHVRIADAQNYSTNGDGIKEIPIRYQYRTEEDYNKYLNDRRGSLSEGIRREMKKNPNLSNAEAFVLARNKLRLAEAKRNKMQNPETDDKIEFHSAPNVGMSLSPPSRSTARRSTGRGSRRGSV